MKTKRNFLTLGAAALLLACAPTPQAREIIPDDQWMPDYGGITTRLLENELVSLTVDMRNARTNNDVIAFNDCAAAQYAVIRGAPFVRRVRNDVSFDSGVWTGEGVYTLSDNHPGGTVVIDAETTLADCRSKAIPTV